MSRHALVFEREDLAHAEKESRHQPGIGQQAEALGPGFRAQRHQQDGNQRQGNQQQLPPSVRVHRVAAHIERHRHHKGEGSRVFRHQSGLAAGQPRGLVEKKDQSAGQGAEKHPVGQVGKGQLAGQRPMPGGEAGVRPPQTEQN